jgi:murein L,D-transpeptidase YafK
MPQPLPHPLPCLRPLGLVLLLLAPGNSAASPVTQPVKADRVLILKSRHELQLLKGGKVIKTYPVALGRNATGPKRQRGDGRTPEGLYIIDGRNAESIFTKSLHISYPNAIDAAVARTAGVEPGGQVMIHGLPLWAGKVDLVQFFRDWTDGCVAVGNKAIEEIWDAVDDGTLVEIRP